MTNQLADGDNPISVIVRLVTGIINEVKELSKSYILRVPKETRMRKFTHEVRIVDGQSTVVRVG